MDYVDLVLLALILVVVLLILREVNKQPTNNQDKNEVKIKLMITIPDDQPDVPVSVSLGGEYKDAEGVTVPVSLVDPTTTDDTVSSFANTTNSGASLSTTLHTGTVGTATITFAAKRDDTGEVVAQKSFDIKVNAGAIVDAPPLNIDLGGLVDA